jgi:hypothetical protein
MSEALFRRPRIGVRAAGITVLMLAIALGPTTSSARARSWRVGSDPNDSFSVVDLRKISTDLSATHLFLKFLLWQRFSRWTMDQVGFYLDSAGSYRFDAFVEFFPGHHRLTCIAQRYPGGVSSDAGWPTDPAIAKPRANFLGDGSTSLAPCGSKCCPVVIAHRGSYHGL